MTNEKYDYQDVSDICKKCHEYHSMSCEATHIEILACRVFFFYKNTNRPVPQVITVK